MNNEEFEQKIKEWVKKYGINEKCVWNIEEDKREGGENSVIVSSRLKVNIKNINPEISTILEFSLSTENKEETICTAVLALNETLNKNLDNFLSDL